MREEELVAELSVKIDNELVEKLISSYLRVKREYIKGDWENVLSNAGKFAEYVYIVLEYLIFGKKLSEIKDRTYIKEQLERLPPDKFEESIRLLIPRISDSMIYDLRSKRGGVHVKEVSPNFMDATLTVTACDWVIAELLRLYHIKDIDEIERIINSIVRRKIPLVQKFGEGEILVLRNDLTSEEEILLLLYSNVDGLIRKELGKILVCKYATSTISNSLKSLQKIRLIFYSKKLGKYVITQIGEKEVEIKILLEQTI